MNNRDFQDKKDKKKRYNEKNEHYMTLNNNKSQYSDIKNKLIHIQDYQENLLTRMNSSSKEIKNEIKGEIFKTNKMIENLINKSNENARCIVSEIKNVNLIKELVSCNEDVLKNQKHIASLDREIKDIKSSVEIMQSTMHNTMNKIVKTVETIQGKLNYLDEVVKSNEELKMQLDNNSQNSKLRPSNLEEEVLINLGEYGEKIIKELTLASRHYAINKDKIENARALEEKHQEELIFRKDEYKKQGKLDIVDSICKRYDNLDRVFESKTIEGRIIQRILSDAGIEKVEEYSSGKIIEITNENRVELEGKVSFSSDSLGKYKIIKSAYELNGSIKQKAELEKVEE